MASSSRKILRPLLVLALLLIIVLVVSLAALLYLGRALRSTLNQAPSYSASELYDKATQQINSGSYGTAQTYLEQALQKQDDPSYRSQLAVVDYRLKQYDQSVSEYQKLVTQKQDPAFAYNGMGNAYRDWAAADTAHQSEYQQDAEQAYRASIGTDPNYVAAYSNLALLLEDEGRAADAKEVLQQGIQKTGSSELSGILKQAP